LETRREIRPMIQEM